MEIDDFDIVRVQSLGGRLGSVRAFKEYDGTDTYADKVFVRFFDGSTVELSCADLELVGVSESPIGFYEVVIIKPDRANYAEAAEVADKLAIVVGIALGDDDQTWFYSVEVQSGEVWIFERSELESVGVSLTKALIGFVESGSPVKASASEFRRGPTPVKIDLEQFRPKPG